MSIDEARKKRFQFLKYLYDITGGNEHRYVSMWDIGQTLGFDREDTSRIVQYLSGEYLLEHKYLGGGIGITHHGVVEVENALSSPDTPTHYFPPVNVINVGTMIGSTIQQGSPEATQFASFENQLGSIRDFVQNVRSNLNELELPDAAHQDLIAELDTLDAQMQTSRPKQSILSECLLSVRTILEGAGGAVVAGLLQHLAGIGV